MLSIAFDLDDTLCGRTSNKGGVEKYTTCYPLKNNIEVANKLYDRGHTIIIYTARGMSTFGGDVKEVYNRLYDLTFNQLTEWGVKFHRLVMGKVHYDILVDDKTFNPQIDSSWDDVMWEYVFNLEDTNESR